jgi:hypothetical protein
MWNSRTLTFSLFVAILFVASATLNEEELAADKFLTEYNDRVGVLLNEVTKSQWNYETNITEANKNISLEIGSKV